MKKMLAALLALGMVLGLLPASALAAKLPTVEDIPSPGTAYAAEQTVVIDGQAVTFQMYALKDASGYGTNYIRLRDLAYALNGTAAQFEVEYDGSIRVVPGQPYTPAGGEMTTPFTGDRIYTGGPLALRVDGDQVPMTAITLLDANGGGYTYFKLRDLGAVLDFYVGWDDTAKKVTLDTRSGAPSVQDGPDTIAQAMLGAMDSSCTDACLVDVDGDGVRELLVLDGQGAELYTWQDGQLTSKRVGALTEGYQDWWLCQDKATGERGIGYSNLGASCEETVYHYPSRDIELRCVQSDGSGSTSRYYIDGREVTKAEHDAVLEQSLEMEPLLVGHWAAPEMRIKAVRSELADLAAGRSVQDLSDQTLLARAESSVNEMEHLTFKLFLGDLIRCDQDSWISAVPFVGDGFGDVKAYRAIDYQTIAQAKAGVQELWYRMFSRKYTEVYQSAYQQNGKLTEQNGQLYVIENYDLGSRPNSGVIDSIVSRNGDEVVFRGHWTFDRNDPIDENDMFEMSLVLEDGIWKYGYSKPL